MATGDSVLSGVHHLERGYDNVLDKFQQLIGLGVVVVVSDIDVDTQA